MKITCPNCQVSFNLPSEKLPIGKKVSFSCPKCKGKIKLDLRSKPTEDETIQIEGPISTEPNKEDKEHGEELKEKILRKLDDLPAMPQVVLKAREIMANPDSGVSDVVKVLETDQAITTKILKTANSAFYGLPGQISDIQHASVVLGYATLGELITFAASSDLLDRILKGYGLISGVLWKHSLSVAIGSRIIAKKKNVALKETAFSTGLIHDCGKLVLDKYVQERKEAFDAIMEHGQETFMKAEEKIFGFSHAEIGFEVCKHWGIPDEVSLAIKHHHSPAKSEKNELAYIVYMADAIVNLADAMTNMGVENTDIEMLMYMVDDKAMEFMGIQETEISPIIDEIKENIGTMAQQIGGA